MAKFFYVYVLQSHVDPERFYSGLTDDLPMTLKRHNSGQVLHTAKWKPWRLKTYVGFSDRPRAVQAGKDGLLTSDYRLPAFDV